MTTPSAARQLQAVGLTEWEARAYLALLEEAPASGYAVAKRSGVPRSKIYEVLDALVAKSAAHVSHGASVLYGPLPPEELIGRLRAQAAERLDAAEAAITDFAKQAGNNPVIWDLRGRTEILERARQVVRNASHRVLLEIWSADADEMRAELRDAAGRDVRVVAVSYGDPGYPFARVYRHPSTDDITAGLGGRWLVLSADSREVIAGIISSGTESRAAWTTHQGLVVPITELVVHDIYKLEMLAAYGEQLESEFGPGLERLREQFAWSHQAVPEEHGLTRAAHGDPVNPGECLRSR